MTLNFVLQFVSRTSTLVIKFETGLSSQVGVPLRVAHLVHVTNQIHQSTVAFMWLMLPLSISGLRILWHGCPVFSLLHAACLKLCLCLSWSWKASPASLRAIPFSLAITIYNRAVIFEVVLVILSRQHLGRCVWYGYTRPAVGLLSCTAGSWPWQHCCCCPERRSKVAGQSWGFWGVLGAAPLRAVPGFKDAGQQCERIQYIGLTCYRPSLALEVTGKLTACLCCF